MEKYFVHPTAIVDEGAEIGDNSKIWHFSHIRNTAKLGKNVIIGKSSYIDEKVVVGNDVKIQNLVSIYQGVTIGNEVFIGPHVVFTNDLYPRAQGSWEITPTTIENGVSVGANATVICGVSLGENCFVAAGAIVTKDVQAHALVGGNPARLLGYVCKCARRILDKSSPPGNYELVCKHCNRSIEITVS